MAFIKVRYYVTTFFCLLLSIFYYNLIQPSYSRILISKNSFIDSTFIPNDIHTFKRIGETRYFIPKDTITPNQNFIRYLISDDSSYINNLYINWGNEYFNKTIAIPNVRTYRSYFTPKYVIETKDYLILEHGCATSCNAVLFLPLNKEEKPQDIEKVLHYNSNNYTVVKGLDNHNKETPHEFVEAYNIKTRKRKRVVFSHFGFASQRIFLIDSCDITNEKIVITANFFDSETDKEIVETIVLENDISK